MKVLRSVIQESNQQGADGSAGILMVQADAPIPVESMFCIPLHHCSISGVEIEHALILFFSFVLFSFFYCPVGFSPLLGWRN